MFHFMGYPDGFVQNRIARDFRARRFGTTSLTPKNSIIGYPQGVVYASASYIVRSSFALYDRSFKGFNPASCLESQVPPT
jgi:hypothetical protein